jgi:hypothetical protein
MVGRSIVSTGREGYERLQVTSESLRKIWPHASSIYGDYVDRTAKSRPRQVREVPNRLVVPTFRVKAADLECRPHSQFGKRITSPIS